MPEFTALKTMGRAGDSQLTDQLQSNLVAFLDWSLLGLGGFFNVRLNTVLPFSGSPSTLRPSDDFRYVRGRAWDSFKTNWIWESNTEYDTQPIQISGIYANGVFLPLNTPVPSSYIVNYPLGRIVFDQPIDTRTVVRVEYSYRAFNTYGASVGWFRQLTKNTFRRDSPEFSFSGSGAWSTFPDSRAQLPAIVVEPVSNLNWRGKQLGGGQYLHTDVLFHVFAETAFDRNNLLDLLSYQNDKRFYLFDKNQMARSGVFPLAANGSLVNPSSTYPFLVGNYLWRSAFISDTNKQSISDDSFGVYCGVCRMTFEVDCWEL